MKKEWVLDHYRYPKKNVTQKKEYKCILDHYDAYIKTNHIMEQNRWERINEYKNYS